MLALPIEDYQHGITCIDTGLGRPGLAACYLMEHQGRLCIIDTGIAKTVPKILQLIAARGFSREAIDYIIITHVHLDHAGGAGGLMQALPNARLVAHPRAGRHMIDPSVLQESAIGVYGEEHFRATYGEIIPVPENRIIIAEDEFVVDFNGRPLRFFDTPGHARHHFCIYDALSRGIFTGDTLGIAYKALCHQDEDFVMPTTTPVQFEPEKMQASVDRMFGLQPDYFYLTHFGKVNATANYVQKLKRHIDNYVTIAQKSAQSANRYKEIYNNLITYTLAELESYGSPVSVQRQQQLIEMDMTINAKGLEVWLASAY